jgi:hypothetical protein
MGKLKEWNIKSQHQKCVIERIFSREVRSQRRERREEGKKKKTKRVMKRESMR